MAKLSSSVVYVIYQNPEKSDTILSNKHLSGNETLYTDRLSISKVEAFAWSQAHHEPSYLRRYSCTCCAHGDTVDGTYETLCQKSMLDSSFVLYRATPRNHWNMQAERCSLDIQSRFRLVLRRYITKANGTHTLSINFSTNTNIFADSAKAVLCLKSTIQ